MSRKYFGTDGVRGKVGTNKKTLPPPPDFDSPECVFRSNPATDSGIVRTPIPF
jgi:hypothetical protein